LKPIVFNHGRVVVAAAALLLCASFAFAYNGSESAPPYQQPGGQFGQYQPSPQAYGQQPNQQYYQAPPPAYSQGAAAQARTPGYGEATVYTVAARRAGTNVVLGGTVAPYKEVTLAAQTAGRVEYIAGAEGDWFEAEQLLLAIDDDDLLAQRRQVLAELGNAESSVRNAQVQYSRELWAPQSRNINRSPGMGLPSLFDQFFTRNMGQMAGAGNPWLERQADLYSQGSQVSQAQARVLQARSRLEEVDARLRDTRAIAPFSGVIVQKLVEVGDTVQPGQPLLQFADTQYLQIQVEVPARLVAGLNKGMMIPARLDVGDTRVNARVAQIFPIADPTRHTVTVKFDLPQGVPGGPGMYAEVMVPDVNVPVRELPVIPKSAVRLRGSLHAVFVLGQDGRTELRLVRLGEDVDANYISVLAGLRVGEVILANPPAGMSSDWQRRHSGSQSGL
jgi:multidrug efflux pump subunit AcrA (membrane-fusion protein)